VLYPYLVGSAVPEPNAALFVKPHSKSANHESSSKRRGIRVDFYCHTCESDVFVRQTTDRDERRICGSHGERRSIGLVRRPIKSIGGKSCMTASVGEAMGRREQASSACLEPLVSLYPVRKSPESSAAGSRVGWWTVIDLLLDWCCSPVITLGPLACKRCVAEVAPKGKGSNVQ